jgi:hypothetical protein
MDKDQIPKLLQLGSTQQGVQQAQSLAKKVMQDNGYGSTLHNACAATLSEFMNLAGIDVPVTLGAGNLARRISGRGWGQIDVGNQEAGDVAVADSDVHIFLVIQAINKDDMVVADNQAPGPHRRKASGDRALNHTPVHYFLRAAGFTPPPVAAIPEMEVLTAPAESDVFPQADEDTRNLKEPFDDSGELNK